MDGTRAGRIGQMERTNSAMSFRFPILFLDWEVVCVYLGLLDNYAFLAYEPTSR